MKKFKSLIFTALLIFSNIFMSFPAFADANSFYFSDATFDYRLKKTATASEMEVEESLTAEFPNYNQNHGIERKIPFLNQNDTNLTTESPDYLSIQVTRNGEYEPFNIKTYDNYFMVRIGNADKYVQGTQKYVLKYKFVNVITEFEASHYADQAYQELYWDSNGTGWSQRFNQVTVNLHYDDSIKSSILKDLDISKTTSYKTKSLIHPNNQTKDGLAAWCYVGRYGASNQDRCEINDISDGISFTTKNLAGGENLSFVTNFKDKTFTVPENDYIKTLNFKDISIDYHLTKDEDNVSRLKVKEKFTVLFPTVNPDSFFIRNIPFVNNAKNSFITDSQEKIDVKATLDDKEIDNLTISTDNINKGFFNVRYSGTLHGEHVFTYEYELKNIIEEGENGAQVFARVPVEQYYSDVFNITTTVHIDDNLLSSIKKVKYEDTTFKDTIETEAFCKENSSVKISAQRCRREKLDDGFKFSVGDITGAPKFGFKIFFEEGTFHILEPNRNYLIWHIFAVFMVIIGVIVGTVVYKKHRQSKDKIKYFKGLPIVPEYTPHRNFTVAEIGKNYLDTTHNLKVATMLELIVNKKVELRKEEKKKLFGTQNKWFIKLIDSKNLSPEQKDLLRIINNGKDFPEGDKEVEIKHHGYSSSLESAFTSYDRDIKRSLEDKGLSEKPDSKKSKSLSLVKTAIIGIGSYFALQVGILVFIGCVNLYFTSTNYNEFAIYEGLWLVPVMVVIAIVVATILPMYSSKAEKFIAHTNKGLEMSRYADGLKLYIKMAESERIEFLQSVKNADTSKEGIVKLYEKLLPYAAIFGLEKSWMKELKNYYELEQIKAPDWYDAGFSYSMLSSVIRTATARPIDTSSSSGGWSGGSFHSSSGSSGGGGGGFSGGGGGGGGGGGW